MTDLKLSEKCEIFEEGAWSGSLGVYFLYVKRVGFNTHRVKFIGSTVYVNTNKVRRKRTFSELLK